jgi:glyoxylase I family protein
VTMTQNSVRWAHVGLNCRDLNATEQFYRRWFGFRRARTVDADGATVLFLRNGDAYLELFESAAPAADAATRDGPPNPGAVRHLAFQVDDVDAFLAAAAGTVPVTLGPLSFDEVIPGWKTIWVTDPDGVVVEVSQGYADE